MALNWNVEPESTNTEKPKWMPILGQWETEGNPKFLGKGATATAQGQLFSVGLAVSNIAIQNGVCQVRMRFSAPFSRDRVQAGGILLGYRSLEHHYVYAQLGAAHSAYTIGESVHGLGWRPLVSIGELQNLKAERDYLLQLRISGQELNLSVDGVPLTQHLLAQPLDGRQVGLLAAGDNEIAFSDFEAQGARPRAFVVMQYAEPFDTFYREVIYSQAKELGFDVVRGDEKAGPGVIFQDIQREIQQAEVVIAEITPANPNVFYEVGYAHALKKPTILLARRGIELPFDIKSFRVVFYDDTIGGKVEVEQNLRKHLNAIAGS